MLFAKWYGEPVDDTTEYLEDFSQTVVTSDFVDDAVEDVVELLADVGAKHEEFAVHSMDDGFEKVAFTRVFTVEELQELEYEGVVDELDGQLSLQ